MISFRCVHNAPPPHVSTGVAPEADHGQTSEVKTKVSRMQSTNQRGQHDRKARLCDFMKSEKEFEASAWNLKPVHGI